MKPDSDHKRKHVDPATIRQIAKFTAAAQPYSGDKRIFNQALSILATLRPLLLRLRFATEAVEVSMVCRSALSLVFSIRWYGIVILAVTNGLAATYPARSQAQVTGSIPSPGAALGSSGDLSLLREAISRAEAGDGGAASAKAERLSDPVARTLVEWFILRSGADGISANRVSRFLSANPGWPAEKTL